MLGLEASKPPEERNQDINVALSWPKQAQVDTLTKKSGCSVRIGWVVEHFILLLYLSPCEQKPVQNQKKS